VLRPASNPPGRHRPDSVELDVPPDLARPQVYEDDAQSILSRNDSPDLPHRWSVNPYRGCMHACAYCYARPSHEFLGFGAGTDFDTRIVVKPGAASLLEAAFEAPSWVGETVLFSGNTDPYQPLEARWELTRACLEVCLRFRNPVVVITKSPLVGRDIDLLGALAREARAHVILSIPFHDPALARAIEPGAPSPARRVEAVRKLAEAGVPVSVNVAPIVPGLNDHEIPAILRAAREAGAQRAHRILVRLPGPVAEVFEERLRAAYPLRADAVLARIRRARGGELHEARFGERMRGRGEAWEATEQLFDTWARKLGFAEGGRETTGDDAAPTTFRRPHGLRGQQRLFGN
jgi:DNA repair photolyase